MSGLLELYFSTILILNRKYICVWAVFKIVSTLFCCTLNLDVLRENSHFRTFILKESPLLFKRS